MEQLPRVAAALRWLSGLWLVAWPLYITLSDNSRLSAVAGMMNAVATLLIPAALAFGLSCALDQLAMKIENDRAARATDDSHKLLGGVLGGPR